MSLIFVDGLEDTFAWTVFQSIGSVVAGRTGNGYTVSSSGSGLGFTVPSAQESDTVTIGFALKQSAFTSTGALIEFRSDAATVLHSDVAFNTNGSLTAHRAGAATAFTTATGLLTIGTWAYIECQMRMHDTLGFITLRINGVQVGTATAIDTKNAGTKTTIDTIRILNPFGSNNAIFDDCYIMAGTGDSFFGDCQVETLYPNGNGNANQWTGSDGDSTNNYLLVDETTPDISDYVGASTSGQQDLYAMGNPALRTGAVLGVCHQSVVGATSPSVTQFRQVNRRTADTKQLQTLQPTLAAYHWCLTTDPETGSPWTYTNLDALQSGVEVA